jgi:hypothetical protein
MYPDKSKVSGKMYLPKNKNAQIAISHLEKPTSPIYTFQFWIMVNKYPDSNPLWVEGRTPTPYHYYYDSNGYFKYSGVATGGTVGNASGNILYTSTGNHSMVFNSIDLYQDGTLTFFNGKRDGRNIPNYGTSYNPSVISPSKIPLNKWTYIIVSVNTNLVDLYINGKIVQSINTKPNDVFDIPNAAIIRFGNKLDASITGITRTASAMDTNTAWNQYMTSKFSLNDSMFSFDFSRYTADIDLLKNKKSEKKIDIF